MEGLVYVILGFMLTIAPMFMTVIVPYMIGIITAFYSILVIVYAFRETGNRALKLISGIIILLLACILIFKPLLLGLTVIIWLGILLLATGIFNIYLASKLKNIEDRER